ncbi:hypothetical protein [Flavihumibacter sp. ZG627]|uniref:hypothetical protein n=1 Tax=Flavihumibacter sp. ZG627 TaxID=1463156 RepID=UPI000B13C868|nr:hypothetical protein [Flavihumibacter sp. ZG627]
MEQVILNIKNKSKIPKVNPAGIKKTKVLKGLEQSVKEVNLIKAGKLKGIPAKDLLNEL